MGSVLDKSVERRLNLQLTSRSAVSKTEGAAATPIGAKIALGEYVHTDQRFEFERVLQPESKNVVEYEWKVRRILLGKVRKKPDAKQVTFRLLEAVRRIERSLALAAQIKRLDHAGRYPACRRTSIHERPTDMVIDIQAGERRQ